MCAILRLVSAPSNQVMRVAQNKPAAHGEEIAARAFDGTLPRVANISI